MITFTGNELKDFPINLDSFYSLSSKFHLLFDIPESRGSLFPLPITGSSKKLFEQTIFTPNLSLPESSALRTAFSTCPKVEARFAAKKLGGFDLFSQ